MKNLLFIFLVISTFTLKATHNRAGEILYKRIAPFSNASGPVYTYSITLITYTDDGPNIADRCNDTIYFGDGSRGIVNRMNGTATNTCNCGLSAGCGEIILNLPNYRVKKNIYTTTHTYAGNGTYRITMTDPNRNAGVINIPNSVNALFSTESVIYIPADSSPNTSPVPTNPPIDRGFTQACYHHDLFAYDADGDSLSYELTAIQDPGFTFPDPGAGGSFSINATTGLLTWCNPQAVGEYNIEIRIKEWRKPACNGTWQLMGYITRDMQILIAGTPSPTFSTGPLADTCVAVGTVLTRTLTAAPGDGFVQVTLFGSCSAGQAPASITPSTNPTTATFSWPISFDQAGKQTAGIVYNTSAGSRFYRSFNVTVVPPAVQIYTAQTATGSVTISWHSPAGCSGNISGYNVYRKGGTANWTHAPCETGVPANSGYSLVFQAQPTDTTFTDIYLQPFANGSNVNYIVTAVSNNCQEGFAESTRSVSVVVGIKETFLDEASVSVAPNPFHEAFKINLGHSLSDLQLELYSYDGKLAYKQFYKTAENDLTIQNTPLAPGLYVLRLSTASGSICKKLVKE